MTEMDLLDEMQLLANMAYEYGSRRFYSHDSPGTSWQKSSYATTVPWRRYLDTVDVMYLKAGMSGVDLDEKEHDGGAIFYVLNGTVIITDTRIQDGHA